MAKAPVEVAVKVNSKGKPIVEYPKLIQTPNSKKKVRVNSAEEEAAALKDAPKGWGDKE